MNSCRMLKMILDNEAKIYRRYKNFRLVLILRNFIWKTQIISVVFIAYTLVFTPVLRRYLAKDS